MIHLLSCIFIKDYQDSASPQVRHAYGVLCGAVGILLNVLLFAAKYLAGVISGSIAVTADAFNNLSDAASSVVTLLGFKFASRKPDRDHPFGHGRYECIAGLIVSFVILLMGFDLAKTSAEKILSPAPVSFSWLSAGILLGSILVKLYMSAYNRSIGRRISSPAILAAAADSLSDVCATAAVLAANLISHFTGLNIDGWAGTLVSLIILWAGFNAAKDTIDPLLGNRPDPELVEKIHAIVDEYPDVVGMHDLLIHDYGAGRRMISLHAEVPANGDIMALHDVIDTIERRLQQELLCSATIHMDPISTDDDLIAATRALVEQRIHAELGEEISIHDFRIVRGVTHTNVIFDAVIPFGYSMSDADVKQRLVQLVQEIEGDYFAVITIDHPIAEA